MFQRNEYYRNRQIGVTRRLPKKVMMSLAFLIPFIILIMIEYLSTGTMTWGQLFMVSIISAGVGSFSIPVFNIISEYWVEIIDRQS